MHSVQVCHREARAKKKKKKKSGKMVVLVEVCEFWMVLEGVWIVLDGFEWFLHGFGLVYS